MPFVNSRFLTQDITGVQRFASEIAVKLKNILGDRVLFVSPKNIIHSDLAKKLGVKVIGSNTGHLWEQIDLPLYLKSKKNPLLINLANTAPMFYKNKISTIHDIAFVRYPKTFDFKFRAFYNFLIPKILVSSRHIITVSEFSKKEIVNYYGIDSDKISVVYNAVGDTFKPNKTETKEHYILAVSSVTYQKNLHSLIRAFNMIDNPNLKLYLVGGVNSNFASVELLNDIKGNKNVILKGRVNDKELITLYSNAQCFVFPSLYEGFGIPPLEAQACGCPVVCSDAASLPEACADSVIYCNPNNVDDIKEKIEIVLSDERLKNELIEKGFQNIKRFSWEKSAKKLADIVWPLI